MTAREVLTLASQFLNKEEEYDSYIASDVGESIGTKSFKVLCNALNIVNIEIASDYFPLLTQEEVDIKNNKIFYDQLSKEIKEVYKISSIDNAFSYRFKAYENYAGVAAGGKVNITYSYVPDKLTTTSDISYFGGKISARTMALGVAAEYCFINNIFDEAEVWHKRFVDSIKNNLSKKGFIKMPKRKWL